MNFNNQPVILIHRQHGVTQRVVTNTPDAVGYTVVEVDDGHALPAHFAAATEEADDLPKLAATALDSLLEHGYGIAADLGGEALLALGRAEPMGARARRTALLAVLDEVRRNIEAVDRGQKLDREPDSEQSADTQPCRRRVRAA